jgi:5'-nucleotidase
VKRLLVAILATLMTLSTAAFAQEARDYSELVFDDVSSEYFYADAVLWAGTRGFSTGVDGENFGPEDALSRADATTLLWRSFGSPTAGAGVIAFADVPVGVYYERAVRWASSVGVVTGTSSTTFSPDATITRAEFSTILWRAYNSVASTTVPSFTDVPAGQFYTDAVAWMIDNAITTGTSATTFSPGDALTRGQGVTFLWRAAGEPETFSLNIFHINDHHSNVEGADIGLDIAGSEVEFELGGLARVAQAMEQLEAEYAGGNNAKVHAGDAITGTLYYTLFAGEADAAVMNSICFDMMTLGNHEFDAGDSGLVTFLDFLAQGNCDTPVLSANVVPALGTPLAQTSATDYIQPYTIETYGDEQVAFIGITVAQKTRVSSQPLDTTQFLDELTTAQSYIDQLEAAGIDKIGLVTHYGYDNDLELAAALSGVDFVIGGDSHTLLGDLAQYGLSPEGPYPTQLDNADGDPVCVGHAWQYSHAVGELNVHFDADGTVVDCTGNVNILLGDVVGNEDGVSQADIDAALAADDQLYSVEPDGTAAAIIQAFSADVDVLAQEIIGTSTDDLCLARFPLEARSQICTPEEVPNGGDIQQLVTDAFLARAFRADIALQNSGGVRIDIPAGEITIADAYGLLPFANTLYELEMTGAEIVLALEQGLGNVLDAGGSTGAYPYGAGIRWDVDGTKAFGSRFSNIEVKPKGATAWTAIDPAATYIVVANSFMVGGGDGYAVLADVNADGRGVDTFLDYAQSFIDYVVEDSAGTISKPTEYSTQTYTPAP